MQHICWKGERWIERERFVTCQEASLTVEARLQTVVGLDIFVKIKLIKLSCHFDLGGEEEGGPQDVPQVFSLNTGWMLSKD